jgi:hypothetical protein
MNTLVCGKCTCPIKAKVQELNEKCPEKLW